MCAKYLVLAVLIAGSVAPRVHAGSDLVENFVTCQGRYAAQEDYDSVMGRDPSFARARAAVFGELVAAVLPVDISDAHRREIGRARRGALGLHWSLLRAGDLSGNARMARHAHAQAARHLSMCEMLVLG
ncbi:MAG: hypothetical protein AAF601_15325 [Pseudomonadota bacterium]